MTPDILLEKYYKATYNDRLWNVTRYGINRDVDMRGKEGEHPVCWALSEVSPDRAQKFLKHRGSRVKYVWETLLTLSQLWRLNVHFRTLKGLDFFVVKNPINLLSMPHTHTHTHTAYFFLLLP